MSRWDNEGPSGGRQNQANDQRGNGILSDAIGSPLLLKVHEVARLLGISVRTVWRKASAQAIPQPMTIGRSKRWRRMDIEAFVSDHLAPAGR